MNINDDDEDELVIHPSSRLIKLDLVTDPSIGAELTPERTAIVDSVMCVLDEAVEKLKICLIIPKIFENPITVRQCLEDTQFAPLIDIVENYLKERKSLPVDDEIISDPTHNAALIKIVDEFHQNFHVLDELPNWLDDITLNESYMLEAFELLKRIAEVHFRKPVLAEMQWERKMHSLYYECEMMKKNVKDLESKVRNQKVNLRWKLAAKDGLILKLEEDLAFKKWDNHMRVQQEILSSSRRIKKVHAASIIRQKELEEELEKTQQMFDKMQSNNLAQEKEARDEKNKALLQLQSLLKKYDSTIGEKYKENILLQEQYEIEKKELDKFMKFFNKEEAEYQRIVLQKEAEDREKQRQKLMRFIMNRAAKIIQRWWRKLRGYNKKGKKKGKGKGKRR